ncbi:hypothetical protein M2272_004635 [Mycobacterium frederiksbergense]|uniref:VWA domain-containing protein n=1 Tax=Mycolicibacterium frederiksbergense TaxID=117567 RepID=A0ABT6L4W8_9MYCO|nr:hypothetical protein [Mycolicibacterium frederiksbergense]MDH6197979.1 hypothetical protein [Mycolicibacterium frederiksbergense]
MDLRWSWLFIVGVLSLAIAVIIAWRLPVAKVQRRMRPLANVSRLTRLPEFARVQRIYLISMAAVGSMVAIAFLGAIVAAARPTKLASANDGYDAVYPRDIVLCVGQPVNDPTTADFLSYWADKAKDSTSTSFGITSQNLRALPITRDNAFAEQRMRYFAGLAGIQKKLDTHQNVPVEQKLELSAGIAAFARPITYVDYAPSLEDTLAMCLSGFGPSSGAHRRQLVYIGYSKFRADDEKRPSVYDQSQVLAMALRQGIQINAISRADVEQISQAGNDSLRALTQATKGRFSLYNPAGTGSSDGTNAILNGDLDKINENPPAPIYVGVNQDSKRYFDIPRVPLQIAVVAALALSVGLGVLRR